MSRLFLVGLVGLSVVLGGCAGGGSSSKSKKCDPSVDTQRCAGSFAIQTCDPDSSKWETVETCAAGTECTEAGGSPMCSASAPPVESCESNADCVDGTCVEGACVPNHCNDGQISGDETYIDCGGSCPFGCEEGRPCAMHNDCESTCCGPEAVCVELTDGWCPCVDPTREDCGMYPQIEVRVDGEVFGVEGGTVSFPPAVQLPTDKTVEIINTGTEDLIISSIDWLQDPVTNLDAKHHGVEASLLSMSFPYSLGKDGEVSFKVTYNPLVLPKDLETESILVISSNARDFSNKTDIKEVVINFSMQEKAAFATVNPSSYTYNNAAADTPETQIFLIASHNEFGLEAFTVINVSLQSPSAVFILNDPPNNGTVVQAYDDPSYEPATFSVTYKPHPLGPEDASPNDSNTIIVETDIGTLTVPLNANYTPGSYSLSFSHPDVEFDFTNEFSQASRRVVLFSEGPGPLTVKQPSIGPPEATTVFSWKAYLPLEPGQTEADQVEATLPRGMAGGTSLEFEVTYAPGNDPGASPNGELIIPISMPSDKDIKLKLFAGDPKPLLDIAPKNKLVQINTDFTTPTTGTNTVVLYNNGNGGLLLKDVTVEGLFGEAKVFSLVAPPAQDTLIQPAGLLALEIAWDSSLVPIGKSDVTETFKVTYIHFSSGEVTESVQLQMDDSGGVTNPTADLGDDLTVTLGDTPLLNALISDSGDGAFQSNWAIFYLLSKPVGSWVEFNVETEGFATFTPDLPGTYDIGLVVYAKGQDGYLFSAPDSATVTVE